MVKLIIETQEAYIENDFNYVTERWENIIREKQYYFVIVADTKAEAEKLYNEIDRLFNCSKCPNHEEEHCNYDGKYTIEDTTATKIDKRKLRKYL